jgi:phosphocarrier protein HPr
MTDEYSAQAILVIGHPAGLHLRPAALFVRTASGFKSRITARNLSRENSPEVDAKSMFGIMQAAVSQGHRVELRATGPDAVEALGALEQLVASGFPEPT